MSNLVTVQVSFDKNLERFLTKFGDIRKFIKDELKRTMIVITDEALDAVRGSGRVPYASGQLRRSLLARVSGQGQDVKGQFGSNEPYAAIHEYGGTFTRSKAWGRDTRPYTVTYRERSYLRTPFYQALPRLKKIFDQRMDKAFSLE